MNLDPGKKIYYTKDNVKYRGQIICVDNNKNIYKISLEGFGETLTVNEEDVEAVDAEEAK